MKTLLVAVDRNDAPEMRAALGDEFELRFCHTLQAARTGLDGIDAVLCGLHFDEGKLFALLEMLNAAPLSPRPRILCIKDAGGPLSPAIRKSIAIAVARMGARGFTDLAELRAGHGEAQARRLFRDTVRELVGDA
ncbi:hypothetical protein [Noviherbaspirillum aridicola]|uniref:Response regulatory domain-containing protein n=1 Tax=Noviherbaspirillum aridicola TaxID=2849687 RepID=A0ABQ4Q015_9BURK|nr:hypothetical protein [Noviherbaspirillum aridicola]GIZ50483.1 hypothetical protein NCCP691_04970 [Noviherbaspirillum aridicola]